MTRLLQILSLIVVLLMLFCERMRSVQQTTDASEVQDYAQLKKMILEQRLLNNMQTTFISLVNRRTMKLENDFKVLSKKLGNMEDNDDTFMNLTSRIESLEGMMQKLSDRTDTIEKYLKNITGDEKDSGREWLKYNGVYYFFSNEAVIWNDAKKKCLDIDPKSTLVSIRSKEVNDFLIRNGNNGLYVRSTAKVIYGREKLRKKEKPDGYWTGGNDIKREGQWVWLDKGDRLIFRNWRSGEPNNAGGEDCMVLITEPSGSRHWNDERCVKFFRYICQTNTLPVQ